jgi:hypothetical protein
MMNLGTEAGMLMALDLQNQIDNYKGESIMEYRERIRNEVLEHGYEYIEKKYNIILCGSCRMFKTNECSWHVNTDYEVNPCGEYERR